MPKPPKKKPRPAPKAVTTTVAAWTRWHQGNAVSCLWITSDIPEWLRVGTTLRITPPRTPQEQEVTTPSEAGPYSKIARDIVQRELAAYFVSPRPMSQCAERFDLYDAIEAALVSAHAAGRLAGIEEAGRVVRS